MKIVYFTHSLVSCWNHGNAHFLRGVLRELIRRGHDVIACEPRDGWSRTNLLADHGAPALAEYRAAYPELRSVFYDTGTHPAPLLDGADVVIVHEWTDPRLVAAIGRERLRGGAFTLLFHDTHHRAVSDPGAVAAFDLGGYDGVLAFGRTLAEVYRSRGWGRRAFVWHEAADDTLFRPPETEAERAGIVWIGNWGDGERTDELEEYLFGPVGSLPIALDVYGVRYPREALAALAANGANYRGFVPNVRVPRVFAHHLATVHVPRRFYARALAGIPTIRVFEALACGIPLVCAPWDDAEGLFRPGVDYLTAASGEDVSRNLRALVFDGALRRELAAKGMETIAARHTCRHRVDELMTILNSLDASKALELSA